MINLMKSPVLLLQCCLLFFLIFSASAMKFNVPRLSPTGPTVLKDSEVVSAYVLEDGETFFYSQTLDHFNYRPESYETFRQRYVISSKHWGGANASAPIFVFLGEEQSLDIDLDAVGFLPENAIRFRACLVYIEHRFYGSSVPFVSSTEEALRNASLRGYFNSAQAIADYAEIIIHLKEKILQARYSPVIVVGGSYGGMLASWFRLKYPHIALGALASSAPILYFDDITPSDGYYTIVTKVFRETSVTCYQKIKNSWAEIDEIASKPDGLSILSKKFVTCNPLNDSAVLKDYLDTMYATAAQYNVPTNWVNKICAGLEGGAFGKDPLGRIISGMVAYQGNKTCYNINNRTTDEGWTWQTCSDLVIPISHGNETMFPPDSFHLGSYLNDCRSLYGVLPRPHWVTAYYGGHSIETVLKRFGSNIIFSNGLKDPYSSGGVLKNISDTITAVTTANGSHCLDIIRARPDDPQWLLMQRETEIQIIEGWITKYYADLHETSGKSNPSYQGK